MTTYSRLRDTDPGSWRDTALAWRSWATAVGRWAATLRAHAERLATIWRGTAADAVATHLAGLLRRLDLFRVGCWAADQALSEFAADLARGKAMLTAAGQQAMSLAARADTTTAVRLAESTPGDANPPTAHPPPCTAPPAEVRRWWATLSPAQQRALLATRAGALGALDGIPAADRDLANRLALDRLPPQTPGLAALRDRLTDNPGPRAYLLRLDLTDEGHVVVALRDPDRAANTVTQVPGMTAGLSSYGGELARAQRLAERATQLAPAAATSAVMWLGYDAPDFLDEAVSRHRADAGAVGLRRFQEGLHATHLGGPAHRTVLGHSYGSVVVGSAASRPGLAADDVVFVGSPGVGVDSAAELHVPADRVWSSTSRTDVIQWAAVSPRSLAEDVLLSRALPGGALVALGTPEDDLYFGTNPSDPAFGARVFASRPDAGHLGYWDVGSESLDALAAITTGRADVTPR